MILVCTDGLSIFLFTQLIDMADLLCASKQIAQTDMEYDDLVQVDASPEERKLEGPTYASPYYYFLREENYSKNNPQTLKKSRTKSPYWTML